VFEDYRNHEEARASIFNYIEFVLQSKASSFDVKLHESGQL